MKFVNLTRRTLRLSTVEGEPVDIEPDPRYIGLAGVGAHRRVEDEQGRVFSLNVQSVAEVKKMPEPAEGTIYIVPPQIAMVLQEERDDVVFPVAGAPLPGHDQPSNPGGDGRPITHLRRIVRRPDSEATGGQRSAASQTAETSP